MEHGLCPFECKPNIIEVHTSDPVWLSRLVGANKEFSDVIWRGQQWQWGLYNWYSPAHAYWHLYSMKDIRGRDMNRYRDSCSSGTCNPNFLEDLTPRQCMLECRRRVGIGCFSAYWLSTSAYADARGYTHREGRELVTVNSSFGTPTMVRTFSVEQQRSKAWYEELGLPLVDNEEQMGPLCRLMTTVRADEQHGPLLRAQAFQRWTGLRNPARRHAIRPVSSESSSYGGTPLTSYYYTHERQAASTIYDFDSPKLPDDVATKYAGCKRDDDREYYEWRLNPDTGTVNGRTLKRTSASVRSCAWVLDFGGNSMIEVSDPAVKEAGLRSCARDLKSPAAVAHCGDNNHCWASRARWRMAILNGS